MIFDLLIEVDKCEIFYRMKGLAGVSSRRMWKGGSLCESLVPRDSGVTSIGAVEP
jgi:hypothetical protein